MYELANAEYQQNQQRQILRIENKRKAQEAAAEAKRKEEEKNRAEVKAKAEAAAHVQKEEEERQCKEQEKIEREKEAERQRQLKIQQEIYRQKKEEQARIQKDLTEKAEKEARDEVKMLLSGSLIISSDDDDSDEEKKKTGNPLMPIPLDKIKKEKDEAENKKVIKPTEPTKPTQPNVSNESVETLTKANLDRTLCEIGSLIVDPDVVYALKNLKKLGQTMKDNEVDCAKPVKPFVGRPLFPQTQNGSQISLPLPHSLSVPVKQEDDDNLGERRTFSSPPVHRQMFPGLKRYTSETFVESSSAKRRRSASTPNRSTLGGSPSTTPLRPEICVSQADVKAKQAIVCDTFLKKKKMTPAQKIPVFQHITKKGREIIEYDEKPMSFYRYGRLKQFYDFLEKRTCIVYQQIKSISVDCFFHVFF